MSEPRFSSGVPLSSLTSLEVGGPAVLLAAAAHEAEILAALDRARDRSLEVFVLGAGSNLIASDRGYAGMLLVCRDQRLEFEPAARHCDVLAGGGLPWDELVRACVARGLSGVECLSGIPGRVGAAPVQNIGAYGQEIAQHLRRLRVIDLRQGRAFWLDAADCGFGYRSSRFKKEWKDRYLIIAVELRLRTAAPETPRSDELARSLASGGAGPITVESCREEVLRIRRSKSMLLESDDPNRRSAGSFFTNPTVEPELAEQIRAKVEQRELSALPMPAYPDPSGRVKLSAAWLMERAGLHRGFTLGTAGLSSRHVLALINRGEATAADLIHLARHVQRRVFEESGVRLRPEPVPLGFDAEEIEDLWGTPTRS